MNTSKIMTTRSAKTTNKATLSKVRSSMSFDKRSSDTTPYSREDSAEKSPNKSLNSFCTDFLSSSDNSGSISRTQSVDEAAGVLSPIPVDR